MPSITQATELKQAASVKVREALALLGNPQATAEDIQKAEGLKLDAESLKSRAVMMTELEAFGENVAALEEAARRNQDDGQEAKGFKSWGEFAGAVVRSAKGIKRDPRLEWFEEIPEGGQKSMSGSSGGAGGFLIPTERLEELMAVAAPSTIIRGGATPIPMNHRTIEIPVVDQTGGGSGKPAFFGGVDAYWTSEEASRTASDAKFRMAALTAHDLAAYTQVSNTLLADADTSLGAFLMSNIGFPGAIAWVEDTAFLRGDGVGKPLGILNSPALLKPASRTTASQIKYDDLVAMIDLFMGEDPVWIVNMKARAKLMQMAGPVATNYAGAYLWGNAETGAPQQLLGYPIFFTDKLPAVGSEGDIMLVDRKYYVIGDRNADTIDLESSGHELFRKAQTAFRIMHRVGGQPWLSAAIKLADDTFVSPFVTLPA